MLFRRACGRSSLQHRLSAATPFIHASTRTSTKITSCKRSRAPDGLTRRPHTNDARRTRRLRGCVRASLNQDETLPQRGCTSYSAELLLAVARLGHLERYRQLNRHMGEEIQLFYEPGAPTDRTRCALLISNIFSPQMDHRPYYTRLEDLAATAALRAVDRVTNSRSATAATAVDPKGLLRPNSMSLSGAGSLVPDASLAAISDITAHHRDTASASDGCYALDPHNLHHLLCAISAINEVVFDDEGLSVNHLDPHDPLNGSLADVMDRGLGNQYSLAIIHLHVASALGLTCSLVGSPEHVLIRIGDPYHSSEPAVYLVDISEGGQVYQWNPSTHQATGITISNSSCSSRNESVGSSCSSADQSAANPGMVKDLCPDDQAGSTNDQWHKDLHTWLKQQQQQQQSDDLHTYTLNLGQPSGTHSVRSYAFEECSMMGDTDSSSLDSFDMADGEADAGWSAVADYAAVDSASRNSWKTLYGPGSLTEWGGLVSSSSSSSGAAFDSMVDSVTSCSSNTVESVDAVGGVPTNSGDSGQSSLESSASDDSLSAAHSVLQLTADDVAHKFGGLQPVSSRVVLQQMLSGMKLSLMMSGREDEALSVVRYLRATDPFSLPDLRDEALLLAHQQQHDQAAALLREYLAVAPGAADAEMVREVVEQQMLAAQLSRNKARWQQQ